MRKISLIISVFLLLSFLCSCTNKGKEVEKTYNHIVEFDGITNFKSNEGNYELNAYLLPANEFINQYDYENIDYYYREHYEAYWDFVGYEKSIIIIQYNEDIYEQAKEFCLREMTLSENYTLEHKGYVFRENVKLATEQDRYRDDFVYSFPKRFNMFAYNDDLKCLIFMGFYCPDYTNDDAMLTIKNWGQFLDRYYSDVYCFG